MVLIPPAIECQSSLVFSLKTAAFEEKPMRLSGPLSIMFLVLLSTKSLAYSSEASFSGSEPDAPGSYTEPNVPYCLEEYKWSGKHTCEEYEIQSHQNDVDEYMRKLRDYLSEVDDFTSLASSFAADAAEWAKCKANEINDQIKYSNLARITRAST
jgi:hypothetical protein